MTTNPQIGETAGSITASAGRRSNCTEKGQRLSRFDDPRDSKIRRLEEELWLTGIQLILTRPEPIGPPARLQAVGPSPNDAPRSVKKIRSYAVQECGPYAPSPGCPTLHLFLRSHGGWGSQGMEDRAGFRNPSSHSGNCVTPRRCRPPRNHRGNSSSYTKSAKITFPPLRFTRSATL